MGHEDVVLTDADGDEPWRQHVIWRNQLPLDAPVGKYPGFSPGQRRLSAGSVYAKGGCRLTLDLIKDQDKAVKMRDGITIYIDVFRPATAAAPLPTIVAWSPYGKGNGGNQCLDDFPFRAGVPRGRLSGLQAWEAPDPAWWCARGYAVVNVDSRGAYSSEGRAAIWGSQEGRDGYDLIEWIAVQPWSNGHVGMSGNSWLAIAQWFVAAERPPHLSAIAPWEGFCDVYRHSFQGGIVDTAFADSVFDIAVGLGPLEDFGAMARSYAFSTPYWQDKVARVERIEIPTYVVGSWTNFLHTPGTFDAWRQLRSPRRWLRVHNTMEWPDYYSSVAQNDLLSFFDRYLKGMDNDWECTPRVRIAVLGAEGLDEIDRPLNDFPPQEPAHVKYYLNAANQGLQANQAADVRKIACRKGGSICFDLRIGLDSEIIGFSALTLWIQLEDASDQDLFVALERVNRRGHLIAARTIPIPSHWLDRLMRAVSRTGLVPPLRLLFPNAVKGKLRLSQREIDMGLSTPDRPVLTHRFEDPVKPGEIVCARIALDPVAMQLRSGENLRLRIAGHNLSPVPLPNVKGAKPRGSGRFSIWCGGPYLSSLFVPLCKSPTSR